MTRHRDATCARSHVRRGFAAAVALAQLGRWLKVEPPWGLTRDQIRTIVHGIRFRGDRARADLLYGRDYRPIDRAVAEFFSAAGGGRQ